MLGVFQSREHTYPTSREILTSLSFSCVGEDEHNSGPNLDLLAQRIISRSGGSTRGARPKSVAVFLGEHAGILAEQLAEWTAMQVHGHTASLKIFESRDLEGCNSLLIDSVTGFSDGSHSPTRLVREHPDAVLVFRGVDEAPSAVLNTLNDIITHGSCVDSRGHTVSFRESSVILTFSQPSEKHEGRLNSEALEKYLYPIMEPYLTRTSILRCDEKVLVAGPPVGPPDTWRSDPAPSDGRCAAGTGSWCWTKDEPSPSGPEVSLIPTRVLRQPPTGVRYLSDISPAVPNKLAVKEAQAFADASPSEGTFSLRQKSPRTFRELFPSRGAVPRNRDV